jgi:DNA-binding GntR family transcriptional regulator
MPVTPRGSSRTEEAHARIRADILAGRHRPGDRLRILELAAALSVSHTVVREALCRLLSDGLVVAEAQRGFRVTSVSAKELADLTDLRVSIECQALRRSIACGDIGWESRIVASAHALSRTAERVQNDGVRLSDEWSREHGIFHEALVSACDSDVLLRVRAMLFEQSERYRRLSVPLADQQRDIDGEHRNLTAAVLEHDADRAAGLLENHLRTTTAILLSSAFSEYCPALSA